MRKPNFFIIGAPKCGTTTLAQWLSQHPQIYFSPQKETRYFSRDLAVRERVRDYGALFAAAEGHHVAIGEGSTEYIYSQVALPDILAFQPQARFIIMLRNPADLVWAWHRQMVFHDMQTVEDFDRAWELGSSFDALKDNPRRYEPKLLSYQLVGALGSHLRRVFEVAGRERCHVIVLDDMQRDPESVYLGVLRFLAVDEMRGIDYRPAHVGIQRRSRYLSRIVRVGRAIKYRTALRGGLGVLNYLNSKNKRPARANGIDARTKAYLAAHFEPEVEVLEGMLGRSLKSWKAGPQVIES